MRLSGRPPVLVGVVHLLPLPGSPRPSPGLDAVLRRARTDAAALAAGGVDAIVVENLGDAPFDATRVAPYTVAAMTRAALAVAEAAPDTPLGINVLRNDAAAALGVAHAVGAAFVRINVHVGAMVTDQGLIEGRARETLLERKRLGAEAVRIVADVLVKHAVPLGAWALEDAARDTALRGLADVLVVSGSGTGRPTRPEDVARVRAAVPGVPVWLGSGLRPEDVPLYPGLDGAIVGTWFHQQDGLDQPIDPARVAAMRQRLA